MTEQHANHADAHAHALVRTASATLRAGAARGALRGRIRLRENLMEDELGAVNRACVVASVQRLNALHREHRRGAAVGEAEEGVVRALLQHAGASSAILMGAAASEAGPMPEPEPENYFEWELSPKDVFLLCGRCDEAGAFWHGDNAVDRVQRAQFRPKCLDCHREMFTLEEDFKPKTLGELVRAVAPSTTPLKIAECFNPDCSGATKKAYVDMRCGGERDDGSGEPRVCRARVKDGDCTMLHQVPAAPSAPPRMN